MDKEKKACPMAMIHVSLLSKYSHLGTNKNLYPSMAPLNKLTRMARIINKIKKAGINTLLAFSMAFVALVKRSKQVINKTKK